MDPVPMTAEVGAVALDLASPSVGPANPGMREPDGSEYAGLLAALAALQPSPPCSPPATPTPPTASSQPSEDRAEHARAADIPNPPTASAATEPAPAETAGQFPDRPEAVPAVEQRPIAGGSEEPAPSLPARNPVAEGGDSPDPDPQHGQPGNKHLASSETSAGRADSGGGTAFAQSQQAMKALKLSEQFAGAGEQNLPNPKIPSAETAGMARSPRTSVSAIATVTAQDEAAATSSGLIPAHPPLEAASVVTRAPSSSAGLMVERISQLVANEAALLRAHRTDSLAVVIKPDAHTELFLHLRQRDGQIEAFVRCDRGDFTALNAGWQDLQERLARQDIRLTALRPSNSEADPNPMLPAGGPGGRQAGPRSRGREHGQDDREELSMAGSITEPLRLPGRTRSRRVAGWETWA